MSYATLQDLIDRAGLDEILQVADRDDDGTPDPEVVASALTNADNMINGFLGVSYQIPLTANPPIVTTWAIAIARYQLHRNAPPDYVIRDYQDAVANLKLAGAGKIDLPGVDGVSPQTGGDISVTVSCEEPVFSARNMEGWL